MFAKQVACAVASAVILAGSTSASLACKGSSVLFKDDFSKVNKSWQSPFKDVGFSIAGGKLLGKSDEGKIAAAIYNGTFFPDADFCADVILPQVDDPSSKSAGILLYAGGPWYIAHITLDGQAGVSELTPDGWLSPIPD